MFLLWYCISTPFPGRNVSRNKQVESLSVSKKISRSYHYMRDTPFGVVTVRITYDCKHHRLNISAWNQRAVHYLLKNSWEIQLGWQKMAFKLWASALILPFGWAGEVFHDGTGIQNHRKYKTVPEERGISGCCSACDSHPQHREGAPSWRSTWRWWSQWPQRTSLQ